MANRQNQAREVRRQNISRAEARNQKASEAISRAVLADIGNTVLEINNRRPVQGRRPITRSYGAQLLANAGSAAARRSNNTTAEVMNEPRNMRRSSDLPGTSVHIARLPPRVNRNVRAAGTRRRRTTTLTSTLVARSEAFCRTRDTDNSETESLLPNIDGGDLGNQLAVVEYVEDIYKFYREIESKSCVPDYMPSQSEINEKMRAVVIDWLIEVHSKFEMMPETLYLATNVFDRYLSIELVSKRNLQLVGITAMFVASKYEEVYPPEMDDFVCIADEECTRQKILTMEKTMLNKLKFHLTLPTSYVFAMRFLKAAGSNQEMENVVFFFLELSLLRPVMLKFKPSMLAAAAVYTAQCALKKESIWNETLKRYTRYTVADLKECARLIVTSHQNLARSEFQIVFNKYSSPQFGSVALIGPAQLPA